MVGLSQIKYRTTAEFLSLLLLEGFWTVWISAMDYTFYNYITHYSGLRGSGKKGRAVRMDVKDTDQSSCPG